MTTITTITKEKEPAELIPVYTSLLQFLEVAGYKTTGLSIGQIAAIKLAVITAIEETDINV